MDEWIRLAGPGQAVELFGIRLVGVSLESGRKLLLTLALAVLILLLGRVLRAVARWILRDRHERIRFWTRQAIQLVAMVLLLVGVASIWFDDPGRLATALGLITAGLAFALQKVVTAFAGYLVILRGSTFNVGDRITMGGRGDVIALSPLQATRNGPAAAGAAAGAGDVGPQPPVLPAASESYGCWLAVRHSRTWLAARSTRFGTMPPGTRWRWSACFGASTS